MNVCAYPPHVNAVAAGKGAYGTVRLALEKKSGTMYACKSISKAKLVSQEDVADVRREVRRWRRRGVAAGQMRCQGAVGCIVGCTVGSFSMGRGSRSQALHAAHRPPTERCRCRRRYCCCLSAERTAEHAATAGRDPQLSITAPNGGWAEAGGWCVWGWVRAAPVGSVCSSFCSVLSL